jgi:hypothetical protein
MENKDKHAGKEAMAALNLRLLRAQRKVSDRLNVKCRNLSPKALMAILIIFSSVCACLLIMIIMGKL